MPLEQRNKVILVADDDIDDQELLEEAFHDIEPDTKADMVSNGKEVLEYLEKCTDDTLPAAIVLDYSMPLLSGAEVLSIICRDPRWDAIPKFVWSTSNAKAYIDECLHNGATRYFVKPSSPDKLYTLAKDILASCA